MYVYIYIYIYIYMPRVRRWQPELLELHVKVRRGEAEPQ